MTEIKKLCLKSIVGIIIILGIWFIILDFSRFIDMDYTYDIYPSGILKRSNVLLAALIALISGKDGQGLKDSRRIKASLIFACLGEAAFTIRERTIGIVFFGFCQIVLIVRNSTGLRFGLSLASHCQKKKLLLASIIIALIDFIFIYIFASIVQAGSFALPVFLYGLLLSTSLLAAIASSILKLLPIINSRMAAAGMLCFFCCDILVGLDALLEPGLLWLLANSLIWIFYIPALTLLALSSYRYK